MKLNLYTVTDADNVIGKVMNLVREDEIFLKYDTDVTNIQLRLALDSVDGINYAYIEELKRYYFVDVLDNQAQGLWMLHLECDVLETYKADIMVSRARFMRNIKTGDYVGSVDSGSLKTITKVNGDKTMPEGSTMILTSVGSKEVITEIK